MPRKPGDTNHSLREKKHLAQIAKLKADVAAQKAQVKVVQAQLKETTAKLKGALSVATKTPKVPAVKKPKPTK